MISSDKANVLFELQEFALNTEDDANLLSLLLPQAFTRINQIGLIYEFVFGLSLSEDHKIQKVLSVPAMADITDFNFIEQVIPTLEQDLLWGPGIYPASKFAKPPFDRPGLKTVVIIPVMMAHKLTGMLIFGSNREEVTIEKEELEFLEIITNLIGIAFRLQEIQSNLTKVTQDVYKMNLKLHDLDKLKDDFVSIASHELRTPMTAIRSYAWMALYKPDIPLSEKMKKYLTRTVVSTERLINLVNDMLNVSRIESGRIEVTPKSFDIMTLSKEVMDEVAAKASEKQLKLGVDEVKVPPVFGDPDKIHEVLLNLVGNALKFTPNGGSINIQFFTDGKVVETAVKDSGVGLSQESIGKLFQKFGRLDSSYTAVSTTGGTGLGLFISKSLVELMKGKIWATSEGVGKGTSFIFSLPIATPEVLKEAEKYAVTATGGEAKALEPVAI
jgi:signal transduction histidine kinase